jgi:hypothetical protein
LTEVEPVNLSPYSYDTTTYLLIIFMVFEGVINPHNIQIEL